MVKLMYDFNREAASGRNLSVLVVEDEPIVALDIKTILEKHGHDVMGPSFSIEKALRILETEQPDVAVLDANVRGQLVTPVANRLRNLAIPFVLASAYLLGDLDESPILTEARNIGKPIDERRLVEAVNAVSG